MQITVNLRLDEVVSDPRLAFSLINSIARRHYSVAATVSLVISPTITLVPHHRRERELTLVASISSFHNNVFVNLVRVRQSISIDHHLSKS